MHGNTRSVRLGLVSIVIVALVATTTILAPAPSADAQLYDAPAIRFGTNARGDIDFVGNTLLTCPSAAGGCTAAQTTGNNAANNQFSMVYVDQDGDGSTFNSSSSTLTLPAGANVLFAGLYWGARSNNGARNQALFQTPGGTYQTVTAAELDTDGGANYQAFYDATAEVQAAGSGTYTVGNVQADTGGGRHAGWSLLVVYEDTTQPFRNLTVFDGFARVNQNNPVEITVDGFTTPAAGPVTAKITQVVYEGDERYSGDQMRFEGQVLSDGAHPAGNFFNSRISKDGALFNDKDPDYVDQLGFDIARTDVTGILGNGQTSATVNYTSQGDWYYVGVVATAIDIFIPDLETDLDKTAVDLNAGDVVVGDTIEYTIRTSNLGLDPALNTFIFDPLPAGTTYVPNSLQIIEHPSPALDGTSPDDTPGNGDGVIDGGEDGGGFDSVLGEVQFELGTIDIGDTFEISYQVTIDPGTEFTTITNTANADYLSATTGDAFTASGSAPIDVTAAAELRLTSKVDDVDPVTAGNQFAYTIDVINDGPSPAINAIVTDMLPAGLTFVSGAGCSALGPIVTCNLATPLGVGATDSAVITVLADADGPATTVTNTATVTSDTTDPNVTNNDGSETTEIVRSTDVSIIKSGPTAVVSAGTDLAYTLTVTNVGPSTAKNTVVSDVLPTGTTLASAVASDGSTCAGDPLLTCDLGELDPTEVVTIDIVVSSDPTLTPATILTNAVSVTTDTPETSDTNNASSVDTPIDRVADLVITKDGPASIDAGEIVSFSVTVTNDGPSVATAPVISDNLPAPLVFDAATSSPACTLSAPPQGVTCALGDMLPGAGNSQTVTISALVPSGALPQSLANTATVDATEDPDGATDDHAFDVTREVALNIAKSDNVEPIAAGAPITYTINAGNDGPSDASGVSVVDSLPAEVAFASATFVPPGAGSCAHDGAALGGNVTCTPTAATIVSGDSVRIEIVVNTPPDLADGVVLSNTATITATEDPVGAAATETTNSINEVNLSIGKVVSPNPVLAGEDVTYTVTFLNEGPSDANAAQFVDTLPTELVFVSATSVGGTCLHDGSLTGGDVTCTFGTLGPNQTVTATIVATVVSATADDTNVTNSVSGSATTPGGDPVPPVTGDAVVNVQRSADLSITKVASPDPVIAGEALAYTITVDNAGPSDASGVAALDPLPSGLTVVTLPAECTDNAGTITCDLGLLAAGAQSVLTIDVTVDPSVQPGTDLLPNTATVSANEPDPDPTNNENQAVVDVNAAVGLTLTKTDNVDPVTAGELVIYTLVAGNTGSSDADGVTITDTPPTGMTFDPTNSSANCLDNAGTIECTLDTVEPGTTESVNLAFVVDDDAVAGTVTNTATVTSDEDPVGATANQDTTIERRADLAIVKTADPEPVVPGETLTYTVTVTNNGPSSATNTIVTDALPAALAFTSVDDAVNCNHDGSAQGGTVTCSYGDLPAGESRTAIVTTAVATDQVDSIANTADATSDTPDPNSDNDSSSTDTEVTPIADVAITKNDNIDPITAGQSITWTIDLTNAGPSDARDVVITDNLPPQVSFTSSPGGSCAHDGSPFGGVLTCTFASIAAGGGEQFDIVAAVDPTTTSVFMVNEVSVSTSTVDADPANNEAGESTAIEAVADLSLAKSVAPGTVLAGEQATYTLTISNAGPSSAQAVNLNDTLPAGVRFNDATIVTGSGNCTHDGAASGGTVACGFGTLDAGETRVVEVLVDVLPSASGLLTNSATVTSPTDPTPPSAQAPLTVNTSADLVMTAKTDDVDPAIAGQPLVWTISIRNDGPSDAVNARIIDVLPAGVDFDAGASTAGCTDTASTVTCDVGTLAPGGTASVEIAVTVQAGASGSISNTASTTSDTDDPDTSNNDATQSTTIEQQAQVSLVKTSSPDPVVAGEQLTYTIVANNAGPSIAADATLGDPLPSGTSFDAASSTQGTCSESLPGLVTCDLGDLAVGIPATITITVDTDSALLDGDALVNTATVDWPTNTGDPVNAPNSTDVSRAADLSIAKVDQANEVAAGTDIVWDLTVTNDGPSDATDVVVTDTLPPDTTFNAAASSAECSAVGSTVTCTLAAVTVSTPGALVIAATVDSLVAPGTVLTNSATVSADETDPVPGNNSDTEETTITQVNDLAIAKSASPEPVVPGEQVTWTITLSNNGPSNASNITIEDQLPAGVSLAGGEVTCTDVPAGAAGATVTCTVPGVAAGDSIDLTIIGDIDPSLIDGNSFDNVVTITGADGTDPNSLNDTATETSTIDRTSGLMVVKAASPATVIAGEQLTFTITLSNEGPSDASAVTLVDALPAGVTFDEVNVISGTADCGQAAGTVSCDVGAAPDRTLAAGDSVVVEIVVTTDDDLADGATVDNTSTADSPDNPAPAEGSSSTPVAREADISIDKSASPNPVIAGETVDYIIVVENDGPSEATGVSIADTLPAGVTWASGDCTPAGQNVTCDAGTIAPGGSAIFSFTATVASDLADGATVTNNAVVSANETDPNPANDDDSASSDIIREADLSVVKDDGDATVIAGEAVTYSITVTNDGPSQASGIEVSDTIPADTSFDSAGSTPGCVEAAGEVTCPVAGPVDPGDTSSIVIAFLVDDDLAPGSTISNTVTVSGDETDPNPGNDSGSDSTPVETSADVSIVKDAVEATAVAGSTMTWTLAVTNAGPSQAADVVVTDSLPSGLSVVSVDRPECDNSVSCTFPTVDVGETIDIAIVTEVDSDQTDPLINDATVTSSTPDPDPSDNTSPPVEVPVGLEADLVIDKTSAPDPFVPGEPVTYTIVVTNNGPSDVAGARVADTTPPEVVEPTAGCSVDPADGACTDTSIFPETSFDLDLVAGASATITITGTVDPSAVAGFINTATVAAPIGVTDPNLTNNTDDDGTPSNPAVTTDLRVTKSSTPNPATAGEPISYEIVVTNDGPSTAVGATIDDAIPPAITGLSSSCDVDPDDGSCSVALAGSRLQGTFSLDPGASLTITVDGLVDPATTGVVTNSATVAAGPGATDPDPSDNTGTDSNPLETEADLSVTKSPNSPRATAGETISWTVTVANAGPSDAENIVVTDTLPTGLSITSEPAGCSAGVCTIAGLAAGNQTELVFETLVGAEVTGSLTNSVAVAAATPDPDPSNNDDTTEAVPVDVVTDLAIVKTSAPDPLVAGGPITYTLTVTNEGPSDAVDATVADPIPDAILGASATCASVPVGGACAIDSSDPASATISIPAGETVVVEVAGTVDATIEGSITNTGTVSPGPGATDPDPSDDGSTNVNPSIGEADLSITKTADPATVVAGESITYTVTVTNGGPTAVTGAAVIDALPAELSSATASCAAVAPNACSAAVAGSTVNGSVNLLPGASATITVTADIDADATGDMTNAATVTAPPGITETDPSDNQADVTSPITAEADVSIAKVANAASVTAGETVAWTVTVGNAGPSTARNVTVTDALPPGATLVAEPAGCTAGVCTIATIGVGQEIELVFETAIASGTTADLVNQVSVTADTPDPDPDNNADATPPLPVDVVTDLSLTKSSAPDPFVAGEAITYTLAVTNDGPSDALGATVTDIVSADVLGAVASCGDVAPTAACTVLGSDPARFLVDIPAGVTITVQIVGTVAPATDGILANTATVEPGPDASDPNPSNNSDTNLNPTEAQANLSVTKTATPNPVVAGETLTFELEVTNAGPSAVADAAVLDVLPPSLSDPVIGCAVTPPDFCGASLFGDTVEGTVSLAPNSSATISVTATVDPSVTGVVDNTVTIDPPPGVVDPDPSDNSSTSSTPIDTSADLSITKSPLGASASAGEAIEWEVVVANAGPSTATGVEVTDTLPPGLSIVAEPALCDAGVCAIPSLVPGQEIVLLFETLVDPSVTGELVNGASVTSAVNDPDPSNNDTETDAIPVDVLTDLAVQKTSTPDPLVAGEAILYSIVVTNNGPANAVGATIVDEVPAAILGAVASCASVAAPAACTVGSSDPAEFTVDIPAGASVSLEIAGTVDAGLAGELTNTVTATPGPGAEDPTDENSTAVDVNPSLGQTDLSITKTSSPNPAVPGEAVTYTLTVTNAGPSQADGATVLDRIPAEIIAPSATCETAAPNTCTASFVGDDMLSTVDLTPGTTAVITIEALVDSGAVTPIENEASVRAPVGFDDPDPSDNDATDVLPVAPSADLVITKTAASDTVVAGETISWSVIVDNDGPSDAQAVELVDLVPTGLTVVAEPAQCAGGVCTLGRMEVGASIELIFETLVTGDAVSPLVNEAAATSATPDPDPSTNSDTATVTVTPSTDLRIDKTSSPSPATAGAPIEYRIVVNNDGPSAALGASVVDVIPDELGDVTVTCGTLPVGGACSSELVAGEARASIDLLAGTEVALIVRGIVSSGAVDGITNSATVAPGPDAVDPDPGDNTAIDVNDPNAVVDLAVDVSASTTTYTTGSTIEYTIVVTNNGPSDVSGARLLDSLPDGLVATGWTCDAGPDAGCSEGSSSGPVDVELDLMSGATITLVVTATVENPVGELVYEVEVSTPVGVTDVAPANNADDTTITAQSSPNPPPSTPTTPAFPAPTISTAPPPVQGPPNPQPADDPLAFSGASSNIAVALAALLFLVGGALVIGTRRRDDEDAATDAT
ncbi:MAG: hypothetical protein AAF567_10900 [Actinomycetota bacterium]